MSRKRRNTSSESDGSPPPKRLRSPSPYESESDSETSKEKPQVDPCTGQSGAFPGLNNNDELFYGPASDGLEYLRMVRSEAHSVPSLLIANEPTRETAEEEDESGYFYDGTYISTAASKSRTTHLSQAQTQYYNSLLARFRVLQATMRCIPELEDVKQLNRPISLPSNSKVARQQWEEYMKENDPYPIQIACMDAETVLELIILMKKKFIQLLKTEDSETSSRLGAWIWAVLGKFRDPGELSSEEIAELRELAAKAVQLVKNGATSGGQDQTLMTVVANEKDVTSPKEPGQNLARKPSHLEMILDMIITIVGEVYGQRDLLEERQVWLEGD